MNYKKYDKLVRDKIPALILARGDFPNVRTANKQEFPVYLSNKLLEEANEFAEAGDFKELVDILEVVYAIGTYLGISKEKLEDMRKKKADEKGSFLERNILVDVWDSDEEQ